MAAEITIKTLTPQPIASIRATSGAAEIATKMGQLLPEVWEYVIGQGDKPAGPPFTRYHSAGLTDPVDLECGVPVTAPIAGNGRVEAGELPGGPAAVIWHIGHYDRLRETYDALAAWLAAEGRTPAGPLWEVYMTDPGEVADPDEWKTEIFCPLTQQA